MILPLYAGSGLVVLLGVLLFRSHRVQNALTLLNASLYLLFTVYSLFFIDLPSYSLNRYFFMDHLSLFEILITSVLFLFSALFSKGYIDGSVRMGEIDKKNVRLYYLMFNLLLIVMTFSFFSNNLALFWVFAELTTAFSAVLVVTLNTKKNLGAALKYVFIASTCMLFSFIGLIFIYALTEHQGVGSGTLDWDVLMANANALPSNILFTAWVFIFIGFAAKSGIVPFHGWLPIAHSKAPGPISAILSGAVTSIGIYGILRMYAIMNQTEMRSEASIILIAFGVLSIAVAAISMLAQQDLKEMFGYSTVEYMGLMLVGIGIGTTEAIYWTLMLVLAHGLIKGLLFLCAGVIHHQYHGVRLKQIQDVLRTQPLATLGLIIGAGAMIGFPPFAMFLPKLFLLIQVGDRSFFLLTVVLLLLFVGACGYAVFLTRMISQSRPRATPKSNDTPKRYRMTFAMTSTIIALIVIILLLGLLMPDFLTDLVSRIVEDLRMAW